LLLLVRRPLFELLNADPALLGLIDAYMLPYAPGFPLLLAMMGINGVLRAQGAAGRSTAILLVYAAVTGRSTRCSSSAASASRGRASPVSPMRRWQAGR
jgi:hypothetical protein